MYTAFPNELGRTPRRAETDNELVAEYLGGSNWALEELYRRYAQNLFNHVMAVIQDEETAKDMVHEIFYKIITRLDQYNGKSFPAWIHTMAANQIKDHARNNKTLIFDGGATALLVEEQALEPERLARIRATRRCVEKTLSLLSPRMRHVFVRNEIEKVSAATIGLELGIKEGATRMLALRARDEFRRIFIELFMSRDRVQVTRS